MRPQTKHTLLFLSIFFLVIGILAVTYFFVFIHRGVSHKEVKAPSSIIDFDGDGKTDIAAYRGSTGTWSIIPSSGGTPYSVGWGGDPSDVPLSPNITLHYLNSLNSHLFS